MIFFPLLHSIIILFISPIFLALVLFAVFKLFPAKFSIYSYYRTDPLSLKICSKFPVVYLHVSSYWFLPSKYFLLFYNLQFPLILVFYVFFTILQPSILTNYCFLCCFFYSVSYSTIFNFPFLTLFWSSPCFADTTIRILSLIKTFLRYIWIIRFNRDLNIFLAH